MNIAKLTVGSLCSGIGGFEKGFENTGGFEVKWQCEIEPYARAVLRKHWPYIPCYEDIYKLCKTDQPDPVDVITVGIPCPPFSRAGKRGGFGQDPLFYEMLRVCNVIRPKYIVFENVEGFKDFKEELRGQVENIGYEWEDALLDSRKFGVPQSRVRYFAVCVRRGVLPGSQYLRGIQRNESESVQRIQSDIANPKGRWTHTVSSKEDWRTIFANSRRSRNNSRISNGMDRIRCLGNAVSPIVAEEIARAILIYEIGDVVT